MRPEPQRLGPGQESVWDYPRPPRLEREAERLRVVLAGVTIADTLRGWRVLETSHPPTYYLPADDVTAELVPATGESFCEWKGAATYFDLVAGGRRAVRAAWGYPTPSAAFAPIAGHLAIYAGRVDACYVGDEQVAPQPGGFYGGWITSRIAGPFKGDPGSQGW